MRGLRALHPQLYPVVATFVAALQDAGFRPVVTSTRRSRAEQTALYRRYLKGRHPYPVAVPGTSAHELGLAFDMVTRDNRKVGRFWEGWGGRYAGRPDPVHFGV